MLFVCILIYILHTITLLSLSLLRLHPDKNVAAPIFFGYDKRRETRLHDRHGEFKRVYYKYFSPKPQYPGVVDRDGGIVNNPIAYS